MSIGFVIDAEEIAKEIRKVATESISEEDLRQGVEYIIRNRIIEKLREIEKIKIPYSSWKPPRARYEVTLVSGLRVDALYGHLIIEYEKPRTFDRRSGFEKAVEQVKQYIRDHAEIEDKFPRYFGVVLDGYKIGFVRYRKAIKDFESKGPFEVNKNTIAKLIEGIIGLRRKALSAEELLKDFGPESSVAKESIKTFYNKLLGTTSRTKILFEDWRRVFSQVCAYNIEKIKGLEKIYGFQKEEADPEKLLFALHTYYALIMKLLAAEVVSLYVTPKLWSYLKTLEDAYYRGHERLKEELKELEEGGIFSKLGITNFLEADYFAWYLDEWDEEIARRIMNIVNKLSNYDPSAAELEPERVKDLFKRLYQNLVPKKIRHDLGEYYTPDWLAELVLDEVGWTIETFEKIAQEQNDILSPFNLRLLDPACGSGTFLMLAIGRLRQYMEEHWIDKGTALRRITKNVIGFDLNPLAVIASRTNYLIALGDMLRERGTETIEIPIYLADSILVERRQTLVGTTYALRTAVGEFVIPTSVVEKGLLTRVLSVLEECVRGRYMPNEFKARLVKEINLEDNEVSIITELFKMLLKLEKEGKDKIWTRVLKNSFAPLFVGKFNYVVGNPPWIHWINLPKKYREAVADLWKHYGMAGIKSASKKVAMGKAGKDISMLFVMVSLDRYLINSGKLGFLITQSVYKSSAGENFRNKLTKYYKIEKVHDLVELKPFEGAQNRTSVLIITKGEKTKFPVPYIIWRKKKKKRIDYTTSSLDEVIESSSIYKFVAKPIAGLGTVWITLTPDIRDSTIEKITQVRHQFYKARKGVNFSLIKPFWVEVEYWENGKAIVKNLDNPPVIGEIEGELLFPFLRGKDVDRWSFKQKIFAIIPHDPRTGDVFSESQFKINYPRAYSWFKKFEKQLKQVNQEPYKSAFRKGNRPIWWLFNITRDFFSPYKVVWRYISKEFKATVICKIQDKPIIPYEKLMFVPFNSEDEAYYFCGIMNSSFIRYIVKASTIETQISTNILDNIFIPKYNPADAIHKKISSLSKKAHELTDDLKEILPKIEDELDELVAQLYDLADDEIKKIREGLAILEGREL